MEISHVMVIFIFRKILIPLSILFCFYRIYKNKIVTLDIIFSLIFIMFLIFARTYSFNYSNIHYDVFDKIFILIIYPICFLILSYLFLNTKSRIDKNKRYKYIIISAFFIIVEILYILNIF